MATSRSEDGDDIPFEDDGLPPPVDQEPARKTTITGSERAAFEKLYKKFKTQGNAKNEKNHDVDLDQVADEYYEDEEDSSSQSLDKIFDELLKGEPRLRRPRTGAPVLGSRDQKSEQKQSPMSGSEKVQSSRRDAKAAAAKLKELKMAERERVDRLLRTAQTDRALWAILNRDVFDQVRKLDLDGITTPRLTPEVNSRTEPIALDPRIVFQNYPHHLITAVTTLRTVFPASQLPLSILPTIKALGRSSYALGATTLLYKHLIHTAWIQQSSYSYIDVLLADMNNGAIEVDADILAILNSIIKEQEMARSGRLGREMQLVYGMEQFLEGIKKIQQWRIVIAETLGVATGDRRAKPRVVRMAEQGRNNADVQSSGGPSHVDGPVVDVASHATQTEVQHSGAREVGNEAVNVLGEMDGISFPGGDRQGDDTINDTVAEQDNRRSNEASETKNRQSIFEAPAKVVL
jgi:hypothetical protein